MKQRINIFDYSEKLRSINRCCDRAFAFTAIDTDITNLLMDKLSEQRAILSPELNHFIIKGKQQELLSGNSYFEEAFKAHILYFRFTKEKSALDIIRIILREKSKIIDEAINLLSDEVLNLPCQEPQES